MVGSQSVPSVVSRRAPQPFFRVFRGLGWGSVLLCCCGCVGVWGRVWFLVRVCCGFVGVRGLFPALRGQDLASSVHMSSLLGNAR